MLTLDEPDVQTNDSRDVWRGLGPDGLLPVDHLLMTVRAWSHTPPLDVAAGDAEPRSRTHGDPRD